MKLINHRKNNFVYCGDCVCRGSIVMTSADYRECLELLNRKYEYAKKKLHTYTRDALSPLFNKKGRTDVIKENGAKYPSVCLGDCATRIILDHYNLMGKYKEQNYRIIIKNITNTK